MIELGLHTDNWRPLSGSFETATESAVKYGLKHIEFAVIHGQNFLQAMGYDPGISAANSGVSFAGNRVQSLTLKKVRVLLSNGQQIEDATARVVHQKE